MIEDLRADVGSTEMDLNDLDAGSLARTVLFVDPQQGSKDFSSQSPQPCDLC